MDIGVFVKRTVSNGGSGYAKGFYQDIALLTISLPVNHKSIKDLNTTNPKIKLEINFKIMTTYSCM